MGVFDKLKNIFFEEEYVEVEEPEKPIKPIKKDKEKKPKEKPKEKTIAKKVELSEMPKVKEEKSAREREIEEEVIERVEKKGINEHVNTKKDNNFKFPMTFEEEDFKTDLYQVKNEKLADKEVKSYEKVNGYTGELYSNNTKSTGYTEKVSKSVDYKTEYGGSLGGYEAGEYNKEQKIFRPTPIISPIYGILDKNYKKDEIVQKKEVRITSASSKKADLDRVREKAYGDLASDITASIMDEPKKESPKKEAQDTSFEDSLYDLTDNDHPVVSNVTVGDAEEYFNDLGLEYNVDYKDNKKEKATGRRSEKKKNDTTEDSLFDLIDSMYKDSEEE